MFQNDFVSIVFSRTKLQILELDSSKKKVLRYVTVDLPDGFIMNHKISDSSKMAEFLKTIWKKLGIKRKTVSVIIPEFSTFIKNLSLPKIDKSELDEAVRWQAADYLPKNLSSLSLDWRIIGEDEKNYIVDLVALDRETLSGYINPIIQAGLYPQSVETPSLALARIAGIGKEGRLVIYQYFDETILLVLNGSALVGSSVESTDAQAILTTAKRIIKHYSSVEFSKLLVGGVNIDKDLFTKLAAELKLTPELLTIAITGIPKEEIHAYLVPLSLQLQKPKDPLDYKSINLIPEEEVEKYRTKRQSDRKWIIMLIATFSIWISLFSALGAYIYFDGQIKKLSNLSGGRLNVVKDTQEQREQIKEINSTAKKVIASYNQSILPHAIINPIHSSLPQGITIRSWDIDLDLGTVVIEGVAVSRENLIAFKKQLEGNTDFIQVTLPISSFEAETNIEFELSFIYLPAVKTLTKK